MPAPTPTMRRWRDGLLAGLAAVAVLVGVGATPARAAEQWTLTPSPLNNAGQVNAGTALTITAQAPSCVPGPATVWLADAVSLRWHKVTTVKLGSSCRFEASLPRGLRTTDYRMALTRGADQPGTSSAGRWVRSVSRITIGLPTTMGVDATPTMTINVGPQAAGRLLEVQASTAAGTPVIARSRVGANGAFSTPFTHRAGQSGSLRLRVVVHLGSGRTHMSGWVTYQRSAPTINARIRATTSADVAKTYRSGCPVGPSGLRTIEMNHWNYQGQVQRGTLIVRANLTSRVLAAFTEAFNKKWPIKSLASPNLYGGDDVKMMAAGLTSAFNCRPVVGNPYAQSPHSYGIAVDINPLENPYLAPNGRWYPSSTYASHRPTSVTGLMGDNSSMVVAMKRQGFEWYKGWDWHHFQV